MWEVCSYDDYVLWVNGAAALRASWCLWASPGQTVSFITVPSTRIQIAAGTCWIWIGRSATAKVQR